MSFSDRLQQILNECNLTIYGASQIIGADTDEPLKTIHERLSKWLRKTPKTIADLEIALNALGYEIEIKRKQ